MNGLGQVEARIAAPPARRALLPAWLRDWPALPALLWIVLWFGINTGPEVFRREPATLLGWLHTARALFPHAVLLGAALYLLTVPRRSPLDATPMTFRLWRLYAVVSLIGCMVASPMPWDAAYWIGCYFAAVTATIAWLRSGDPLKRAVQANHLSWIINTLFLLILVIIARQALFADTDSGYNAYGRMRSLAAAAEMPMSRSSGMARFAAVSGVVAFLFMLAGRGAARLFWAALFVASATLLYFMQSRGAMFAFPFALLCALWAYGKRGRLLIVLMVAGTVLALVADLVPASVGEYLTRGQGMRGIETLGGRTRYWERGLDLFWESPLWGFGPQADRYFDIGHIHNTYLYALLAAGFLGATAFAAGMVLLWLRIWRLTRSNIAARLGAQITFAQVAGILAFFTLRSISEVSGPLFCVDLVVMLPGIALVGVLSAAASAPPSVPPAATLDRRDV